jgi:hypothetical protein
VIDDDDEQVFALWPDMRVFVRDRVAERLCTLVPETMMMVVRTDVGGAAMGKAAQEGLDRATALMNLLHELGASSGEGDSRLPTVVEPALLPALSELAVELAQSVPDEWERAFWEEAAVAAMVVQADDASAVDSLLLKRRDDGATGASGDDGE